jgi:hypothetical protein
MTPEINEMFAHGVPARQWKQYHCNIPEYAQDSLDPHCPDIPQDHGDNNVGLEKKNDLAGEKMENIEEV